MSLALIEDLTRSTERELQDALRAERYYRAQAQQLLRRWFSVLVLMAVFGLHGIVLVWMRSHVAQFVGACLLCVFALLAFTAEHYHRKVRRVNEALRTATDFRFAFESALRTARNPVITDLQLHASWQTFLRLQHRWIHTDLPPRYDAKLLQRCDQS